MNKNEIMNNVKSLFCKAGFKLRQYSPEILAGAGAVGVIAGTVMACKATTKAGEIVETAREELRDVRFVSMAAGITDIPEDISEDDRHMVNALARQESTHDYTEKDMRTDTARTYLNAAGKFIKLYGPSVIVVGTSLGMMLTSNGILQKRQAALAAAYATVDKGFKEYRGRVIERFGKDVDTELRHDIKAKKFKEPVLDDEGNDTGKTKNVTVNVSNPDAMSVYARCFDETCPGWTKDAEYNLAFLKQRENYANDLLKSRGYLFLNEVYDMLGLPKTRAGQCVGWIYNENNPVGDNYVDFGIYNINKESNRLFVNGYERSIWLDFNVDGDILSHF